jgi:Fe-S cluster assembly protein SufB
MAKIGISEEVVRQISLSNNEPDWMLEHRLRSLALFEKFEKPTW